MLTTVVEGKAKTRLAAALKTGSLRRKRPAALNAVLSRLSPPETDTVPCPPRTGPAKCDGGGLPAEVPRAEQVIDLRN